MKTVWQRPTTWTVRLLLVTFVLSLAVSACRSSPTPAPTAVPRPSPPSLPTEEALPLVVQPTSASVPSRPTATSSPRPPVRVGFVGQPDTWWVESLEANSPTEAFLRRLTTRALARQTDDGRLAPDLGAWRWDGETLVITLEEETWSDGAPLVARDVSDALRRARQRARFFPLVAKITPVGARTVRVTFGEGPAPCPAATELLLWPLGDGKWPPARTLGPYSVRVGTSAWHLRAREGGWPDVTLLPFEDSPALVRAWEGGQVDLIVGDEWLYGREPPAPPPGGTVKDVPGMRLATLTFRLAHPALQDVAVRRALALATDPAALATDAYGAPLPPLTALLPPGHWAAPAEGVPTGQPEAAAKALEEAGWLDRDGDGVREDAEGTPLTLTLVLPFSQTDARWERLGFALQQQWARVGVRLEPLYVAPLALRERLSQGRWDVALLVFAVGPDPDQEALWRPPDENPLSRDLNVMGYANAQVIRLMGQAARVPGCDPNERAALYRQAWALINQDAPLLPLFPLPVRLFVAEAAEGLLPFVWPEASEVGPSG